MFRLIKFIRNQYVRRATPKNIGMRVSVPWDSSSKTGVIDRVSHDGGFDINFGDAIMVVPAMIRGYRVNPFRNVTILK